MTSCSILKLQSELLFEPKSSVTVAQGDSRKKSIGASKDVRKSDFPSASI